MSTITMLEFRHDAARVFKRLAQGERFVLTHRGKPVANIEPPLKTKSQKVLADDPLLKLADCAEHDPNGPLNHEAIDRIVSKA